MQLKLNNLSISNSAEADLAFVMKLEREAAKTGNVITWAKEEHLLAIERDNTIHMMLRDKGQSVG